MNWAPLIAQLVAGGPSAVILLIIIGFTGVLTGVVRLPREYDREAEGRKLAEAERDQERATNQKLREQRDIEHEQKIRTLELLNAALAGRRQQEEE